VINLMPIVLLATLHLFALTLAAGLMWIALGSEPGASSGEGEGGWDGGGEPPRPSGPLPGAGGLPLRDAAPARVRLRDHAAGRRRPLPPRRAHPVPDRQPGGARADERRAGLAAHRPWP
jgi:hypothetical protein